MKKTIQELVAEFHEGALGMGNRDVAAANAAAKRVRNSYKVLRETEAGRIALLSLMEDEDPAVRLNAAGACLRWAPECARPVLEELRDSNGLWSFEAKWTLIGYDKGHLMFDE
jgi:hypothetical protein